MRRRFTLLQGVFGVLVLLVFVFVLVNTLDIRNVNRQVAADVVALEALTGDNRVALRSLCATTAAIRNLDLFFLGVAKPRADETEDQRKVREAFVKLIKSDIARMNAAGDVCSRLRAAREGR